MHADLIGGRLKFATDTLAQNVSYMQDNRLRAVAMTSPQHAGISLDVPTVIEAEAVFYVGHGYRAQGVVLPQTPFLEVVHYHFGIDDPQQQFHLPFKYPPWGYSCFRGGA